MECRFILTRCSEKAKSKTIALSCGVLRKHTCLRGGSLELEMTRQNFQFRDSQMGRKPSLAVSFRYSVTGQSIPSQGTSTDPVLPD